MKKIIILVLVLCLTGCMANEESGHEEKVIPDETIKLEVSDNIKLVVDPRIELTYMVFHALADETGFDQYGHSSYMDDQLAAFPDQDHEIYDMVRSMYKNSFSYDAIPGLIHHFNHDTTLKEGVIIDQVIFTRAGGMDQAKKFIKALDDYRKDIAYDDYFYANKDFYMASLEKAEKFIIDSDMEAKYLDFYGQSLGQVLVTVTPENNHGYGCKLNFEDEMVLMPTLSVLEREPDYIAFLLHEISHSYVNPETHSRPDQVKALDGLLEPIKDAMARQAYSSWEYCLNEHIVRANVIEIMTAIYGSNVTGRLIAIEKNKAFIYIDNVMTSLEAYQSSRETYKTFDMYMDNLLDNLRSEL